MNRDRTGEPALSWQLPRFFERNSMLQVVMGAASCLQRAKRRLRQPAETEWPELVADSYLPIILGCAALLNAVRQRLPAAPSPSYGRRRTSNNRPLRMLL